jgi:hypothetical protein
MNKNQSLRLKSGFLLAVLLFNLVQPYVLKASTGSGTGGDAPVSSAANNFVDMHSGDLNYSVPLMVVPGPNGEVVDITASYQSGITMNQSASWLGLGWNYNPGEITCAVNGVADDASGKIVSSVIFHDLGNQNETDEQYLSATFGPLHFADYNNTTPSSYFTNYFPTNCSGCSYLSTTKSFDMSILNSENGYNPGAMSDFKCPAYDKFYVSGPGIGGKMRMMVSNPSTASSPNLTHINISPLTTNSTLNDNNYVTYNTPQFIFENSAASYNSTNNSYVQGVNVKYYLNNTISSSLYSNTTHSGFLDYTTTARTSTNFDMNGIGGD